MTEDTQKQIDELKKQVESKDNLIGHLYGRIAVFEDALSQTIDLLDSQSLDSFRQYIASKSPSDYTPGGRVHRQNGALKQLEKIKNQLSA